VIIPHDLSNVYTPTFAHMSPQQKCVAVRAANRPDRPAPCGRLHGGLVAQGQAGSGRAGPRTLL